MQATNDIPQVDDRKTLKDFIPLVLAFFSGLIILSIYQNLRLYFSGVLDSFLNKSFLLLVLHHTGFTAIVALFLSFLFNYLENRKSNLGFKTARSLLLIFLAIEGLLIAYYVQNYEILGVGIFGISDSENIRFFMLPIVLMLLLTALIFHYTQKVTASFYQLISRMYPFTIILFSLFLATLNSDKKPINENKTQHLLQSVATNLFDFNTYNGALEYPLLRLNKQKDLLGAYFNLGTEKPNIVILVVEGFGADFVGDDAKFKQFAPRLNALSKQSLFWKNFVSNTGTGFASFPMIMGSLPFGENGFSNIESYTNRNTLFSILKQNGYTTSFNYGGNSALNRFDRFLDEERVDFIIDKNAFGNEFQLQDKDAAGISLGYPDDQLFKKWHAQTAIEALPRFDVFLTLSSKNPFLIPDKEKHEAQVDSMVLKPSISAGNKRLINNHKEVFASILYADGAVSKFIEDYKKRPEYHNTLFIITGSHHLTDLPNENELGRYQVPFMIYSTLLKTPSAIRTLASHADIAPSLITLLDAKYGLKTPQKVAWLGNSLVASQTFIKTKQIPLMRDINNIPDFINGNTFLSAGDVYQMDENLNLLENTNEIETALAEDNFRHFKAINAYVTSNNKLIPESISLVSSHVNFSKTDMIWVESVFNGKDVDNAYSTARRLAFDKDFERSLLLSKYILSQTPRHADTEILMGRVYSWQKDYKSSEEVLKEVIRKYPKYADGYAALLDTYHWAGTPEKALDLIKILHRNEINATEIAEKIKRAKKHILKETALHTHTNETHDAK